jgi:subtilisin family serine protease
MDGEASRLIDLAKVLVDELENVDPRLVVLFLEQSYQHAPRRAPLVVESPDYPSAGLSIFELPGVSRPRFVTDASGYVHVQEPGAPENETEPRPGDDGQPPGGYDQEAADDDQALGEDDQDAEDDQENDDGAEEPDNDRGKPPFYFSFSIELPPRLGAAVSGGEPDDNIGKLIKELVALAKANWIVRLAPELRPQIDFSVPEVDASPDRLPFHLPAFDGRKVILGVVDYGLDIAHPNFRFPDGRTRVAALWDHNPADPWPAGLSLKNQPPPGIFPYGRLFRRQEINLALDAPDPYWALGYDPHRNYYQPGPVAGAHGTHVTDIAAGNGSASRAAGVAPGADIVFVQLAPDSLKRSLASPIGGAVLDGVLFIFWLAQRRRRAVVVNLSLNTNTGPHDGSNILERAFDVLLQRKGRTIVVPAGNFAASGLHASGQVRRRSPRRLVWHFEKRDRSPNELEIWYETADANQILDCTLIEPDGTRHAPIPPSNPYVVTRDGQAIGFVMRGVRPGAGLTRLHQVYFKLWPWGRSEDWQIELAIGNVAARRVDFDAWIERDDKAQVTQSRFGDRDADPAKSLGSLSCGRRTIVVGAYYEIVDGREIAFFSSAGPTRDGRKKPDVSAPGFQILAARSKGYQPIPGSRFRTASRIAMSGTSQAAPHVAGLAALLLQKIPTASSAEIGDAIRNLSRPPPELPAQPAPRDNWHPRYGFGTIDVAETLAKF